MSDARTVSLYREQLLRPCLFKALSEDFDGYLTSQGYPARCGQIIDTPTVLVPVQGNSRDDGAGNRVYDTRGGADGELTQEL